MADSEECYRPTKRAKHEQGLGYHPVSPSSDGEPVDALSPMSRLLSADESREIWTPPTPESQNSQTRPQQPRAHIRLLRRLLPADPIASPEPVVPPEPVVEPEDPRKVETDVYELVVSPFTVDEGRLHWSPWPRFTRPKNGEVNGYVKVRWASSRNSSRRPSGLVLLQSKGGIEDMTPKATRSHTVERNDTTIVLAGPEPAVPDGTVPLMRACRDIKYPNMLPPQFGLQAEMDHMDRQLFDFYINNWCPGRTVLNGTNLWLKDLAPMHENEGILYAILSLAGIYIYDYVPSERLRRRINERYALADQCYSKLLNAPENRQNGKGQEVITLAVLLSMQDIVLTEQRLKKPHRPRWLEGFQKCEYFLEVTDPATRYRKSHNVQYSELRISQSIIVGRGVILAQLMVTLPTPETFNSVAEAGRFSWLVHGTETDVYKIHGGCGFSRKLLHVMSQVTWCAGRLHQDPGSTVVPITATYLLRELSQMRQWSEKGKDLELARKCPPTIEWVRNEAADVIIDSNEIMTEVTAEAWRIAAIIYCQCRLLRLPRNHPEVLVNLEDLAQCIRIMPTSGNQFTAQAPLLPIFLLGLLATTSKHMAVSKDWFEAVVKEPVRSSVPLLYEVLDRIWGWIGEELKVPKEPTAISKSIGDRKPWWEDLVAKVCTEEEETLCLT
ncbi:Fungal transcription factor [Fusarium oxysporum f. sp. vasinfectum]|nr:Fungal transcription factor [Fusarium oxysporum f. sp. vasinfectum]